MSQTDVLLLSGTDMGSKWSQTQCFSLRNTESSHKSGNSCLQPQQSFLPCFGCTSYCGLTTMTQLFPPYAQHDYCLRLPMCRTLHLLTALPSDCIFLKSSPVFQHPAALCHVTGSCRHLWTLGEIPLSLPFSSLKSQLSQPLLVAEMLQALQHLHGPLLDALRSLLPKLGYLPWPP